MSGFPQPGPWTSIGKDLSRPNRRAVIAVISFVGHHAPQVMNLKRGDILVCDASEQAIKQQLTSIRALRTYYRKGVEIFSIQGLHAKVISSPTSAWIGSANASRNSRDHLIEASIRVVGAPARRLRAWTSSLATEDNHLDRDDLNRLARIKVNPRARSPRVDVVPSLASTLPESLVFVETGEQLTDKELRTIDSDQDAARHSARGAGFSSRLDSILLVGGTRIRPGNWIIEIRNSHVRRPAYVVRTKSTALGTIVWFCMSTSATRPAINEIREMCPGLMRDFAELRIREANLMRQVLSTFGKFG